MTGPRSGRPAVLRLGRAVRRLALAALAAASLAAWAAASDWTALSAAQRQTLEPLRPMWAQLAEHQRQRWLEVANRFASMPPAEQTRAQERMRAWARLTPTERGQIRLQFHEAQNWTAQERQERWEAYQSLDPIARHVLAHRWKLEAAAEVAAAAEAARARQARAPQTVPATPSTPRQAATPTAARARTGVTTKPISAVVAPVVVTPQPSPLLQRLRMRDRPIDPRTLLPLRPSEGRADVPPAAVPETATR